MENPQSTIKKRKHTLWTKFCLPANVGSVSTGGRNLKENWHVPPKKPQPPLHGTSFLVGHPPIASQPYCFPPPKLQRYSSSSVLLPLSPSPPLHPLPSSSTPRNTPSHPPSKLLNVPSLPHVVMPLDVNLVENPLRGLQEVFLHLHGDIPGQEAHEQPLLSRRNIIW